MAEVGVPFLPPASTTMLQTVIRSSIDMASIASPQNSMDLYVAPEVSKACFVSTLTISKAKVIWGGCYDMTGTHLQL